MYHIKKLMSYERDFRVQFVIMLSPLISNFSGLLELTICIPSTVHRGYYMVVRRYGFYLRVLIISLTSEQRERVRNVFNTRRLIPYLQATM